MSLTAGSPNAPLIELYVLEEVMKGLQGVAAVLAQPTGEPLPDVEFVPGNISLRQYILKKKDIVWPFVGLTLSTFGLDRATLNNFAASRDLGWIQRNTNRVDKLRGVRVMGDVQFRYAAQNWHELMRFLQRWMLRFARANFVIKAGELKIPVTVMLNRDNIAVPPMELDTTTETINFFQMDLTMTFRSYVLTAEPATPTKSISVTFKAKTPSGSIVPLDNTIVIDLETDD